MFTIPYVSCVTCHMSHVTCLKNFLKKIKKNYGASRWRVCYQRGLPLLVLEESKFQSSKFEGLRLKLFMLSIGLSNSLHKRISQISSVQPAITLHWSVSLCHPFSRRTGAHEWEAQEVLCFQCMCVFTELTLTGWLDIALDFSTISFQ